MSSSKEKNDKVERELKLVFPEDDKVTFEGEKPWIKEAGAPPQYGTNDPVYIVGADGRKEGPYTVSSVDTSSSPPTYILETDVGTSVNGGRGVAEGSLSK